MTSEPSNDRIRVLTVDDHAILREGIASIIEIQPDVDLVGEASNGREAVEKYRSLKPDVTLMDLEMPVLDGISAIDIIRRESPDARIVVLTTYEGDVQATRALQAGAAAFLLKSSLRHELLDTIRGVHAGRRHISSRIAQEIALRSGEDQLTAREVDVLRAVAQGKSNKEIAFAAAISEETVKTHIKNIFSKLGVDDRTHAVTVALRRGIITI